MRIRAFVLAAAFCLAAALPATAQTLTKASLRLKWLPQNQFAGYYVALARGYYRDAGIDLTINPGGPNLLTENLIATGADTFGVSGGTESVMAAREKGLPIIAIGIGHQVTPFVFITRKDGPVKTLQDFEGKKVTAWFTGSQLVLKAMLTSKDVDLTKVNLAPQQVSFTPFINGDTDVATATLYSDVAAVEKRLGPDSLRIFNPENYDITIPRDTVIVSEATAKSDPHLVEGFLLASIKGWQEARRHPDEAVSTVLKVAPTLDRETERASLEVILKLMAAGDAPQHGLLTIDMERVKRTEAFLLKYGALSKPVDVAAAFRPEFLETIPLNERLP